MNMLRPAMASIMRPGDNYYSFVVAVAKRAREIAVFEEEENILSDEKPVQQAVEEFAAGKYRLGANEGEEESLEH